MVIQSEINMTKKGKQRNFKAFSVIMTTDENIYKMGKSKVQHSNLGITGV